MKEKIKISIIIPCYNSSSYIVTCVDSLKFQSDRNWEAIIINDGSKDNTLSILKSYSEQDLRIKVYSQENQGAAKAREYGISKASGEYITFLDVDDTLEPDALEKVAEKLKYNPDLVVANFNIVNFDKIIRRTSIAFEELSSLSYLQKVLIGKYGWELCGKVYKKELFDLSIITPTNFRIGEDAAVFVQIVSRAKKIVACNYPIYNYIQNFQSASHIKNRKYAEETLLAGQFIEDYLKQQPFYDEIKEEISAMHLLFYSNSSFKYTLPRNHPLVKYIIDNHFKIASLFRIPLLKAFYVLFLYLTDGKIAELFYKLKR